MGKGPAPTPQATCKPQNKFHINTKFVKPDVNFIKNESIFFITEFAPGISLRCFIVETALLKLPKRSLADRA